MRGKAMFYEITSRAYGRLMGVEHGVHGGVREDGT